jgi:hypothetical protein
MDAQLAAFAEQIVDNDPTLNGHLQPPNYEIQPLLSYSEFYLNSANCHDL